MFSEILHNYFNTAADDDDSTTEESGTNIGCIWLEPVEGYYYSGNEDYWLYDVSLEECREL